MMNEFDLIETYFAPLSAGFEGSHGLHNDGAVLSCPEGMELVVSSDTLSDGTHFLSSDMSASEIAKKALRTNLSDLAAMGARPYAYQLCLALPQKDEAWIAGFSEGLKEDQDLYGITLSGGDTTSILGPLTVSITAFGMVGKGKSISRSGAKGGDLIVITGSVGDAFCGLQALRGQMSGVPHTCLNAYKTPSPPSHLGPSLSDYGVHAAIDVSDGLLADVGHICSRSKCGADIDLAQMKFSDAVQGLLDTGAVDYTDIVTGGDDYQLVMAVAPGRYHALMRHAQSLGISLQKIGVFNDGPSGVMVKTHAGEIMNISKPGWTHF